MFLHSYNVNAHHYTKSKEKQYNTVENICFLVSCSLSQILSSLNLSFLICEIDIDLTELLWKAVKYPQIIMHWERYHSYMESRDLGDGLCSNLTSL